jgi:alanyl-tRNA synthetase
VRGKEVERLKEAIVRAEIEEALTSAEEVDGVRVVSLFVPHAKVEELRRVTDMIRGKATSSVAAVGTIDENKGVLVVAVGKDIQGKFNAGSIVKRLAERFNGKGGGGPQIAQGGVPGDKVREALNSLKTVLSG